MASTAGKWVAKIQAHPIVSTVWGFIGVLATLGGLWYLGFGQPPIPAIYNAAAAMTWPISGTALAALVLVLGLVLSVAVVVAVAGGAVYARREADRLRRDVSRLAFELEQSTSELARTRNERDAALRGVADLKRQFGRFRLNAFADRVKRNIEVGRKEGQTIPDIRVTVRFAVYTDLDLANSIASILREVTGWQVVIDGSNSPTLMPDPDAYKVVFDVGAMRTFDQVAIAFNDGELLGQGVRVGAKVIERWGEPEHLVIEVLPAKP